MCQRKQPIWLRVKWDVLIYMILVDDIFENVLSIKVFTRLFKIEYVPFFSLEEPPKFHKL
jgi:hypothetical protein